jgi:hypothetical protein
MMNLIGTDALGWLQMRLGLNVAGPSSRASRVILWHIQAPRWRKLRSSFISLLMIMKRILDIIYGSNLNL